MNADTEDSRNDSRIDAMRVRDDDDDVVVDPFIMMSSNRRTYIGKLRFFVQRKDTLHFDIQISCSKRPFIVVS